MDYRGCHSSPPRYGPAVVIVVLAPGVLEGDPFAGLPAHPCDELFEDATAGVEIAVANDAAGVRMYDGGVLGIVLYPEHLMHNSATDFQVAVAERFKNILRDSEAAGC